MDKELKYYSRQARQAKEIFDNSESTEQMIEQLMLLRDKFDCEHYRSTFDSLLFSMILHRLEHDNLDGEQNEDIMRSCCLLAESNDECNRSWENGSLAEKAMACAVQIENNDETIRLKADVFGRMADTLHDRPRLTIKLLTELASVVDLLPDEARGDYMSTAQIETKKRAIESCIALAESGQAESILPEGRHLNVDPVEFTARWEEVIDRVEKQLYVATKDEERYMGFCFRYWSMKTQLLREEYGIEWRSPSVMNPRVMFD